MVTSKIVVDAQTSMCCAKGDLFYTMANPSDMKADNTTKVSPTANTRPNRLPAPSLFIGPPSRNSSQLSVSRQLTESSSSRQGRDALTRQKSALNRTFDPNGPTGDARPSRDAAPTQLRKPSDGSIDARWREMQSTLDEVEMTAQSSTHVFGETHAAALDDLRKAQVELARAWGRGSDDGDAAATGTGVNSAGSTSNSPSRTADDQRARRRAGTDASVSSRLSDESVVSDATLKSGRGQLEDETAEDIRLASERRAANEAYFTRVDESVKRVVAKLEAVADAMRGVEGESRSLWSGTSMMSSDNEGRQQDARAAAG